MVLADWSYFDADDDGDDKENSFIKAPWDDIYIYITPQHTMQTSRMHFKAKGISILSRHIERGS